MLFIILNYKLKTKTMSKTKDAFIRMREQELYEQEIFDIYNQTGITFFSELNRGDNTDSIFKDLILKCINDETFEVTINVSNADGDFDTDDNHVLCNVLIDIECSNLTDTGIMLVHKYIYSVKDIVILCKQNDIQIPNEPNLADIRYVDYDIVKLLLSR